jgi:tRNA(His) guanylyltransferase
MKGDSLGDRMKHYEAQPRGYLVPRTPVLMRLDGKAFHTLTRGMDRPWDARFTSCMWETAKYLAEHVSGCQLVYTQSDEISLLLTDYETIHTQGWFGYDLQKMVSVSASMAAVAFAANYLIHFGTGPDTRELPAFDSRAWNLPREEVKNYFIWRQQDATRNSVQMLGQAHFSHKQLHGKSCDEIQGMLLKQRDVNWNDSPVPQKRGACVVRHTISLPATDKKPAHTRRLWSVDQAIPVFTADHNYIDRYVWPELDSVKQIQQEHAESDQ